METCMTKVKVMPVFATSFHVILKWFVLLVLDAVHFCTQWLCIKCFNKRLDQIDLN